MTESTIKKSILKLRKLGLWREKASHPSSQRSATRVASKDTRVTKPATPVADKKSFSPLKTDSLLDNRLENNKKVGLENAAVAAKPDILPDNSAKTKISPETSVSFSKKDENSSSIPEEKIDLVVEHQSSGKWTVPRGADGRPMTKQAMAEANFLADQRGEPAVFTESQIGAGRDRDKQDIASDAANCEDFFA